jgi:hypothetical protein
MFENIKVDLREIEFNLKHLKRIATSSIKINLISTYVDSFDKVFDEIGTIDEYKDTNMIRKDANSLLGNFETILLNLYSYNKRAVLSFLGESKNLKLTYHIFALLSNNLNSFTFRETYFRHKQIFRSAIQLIDAIFIKIYSGKDFLHLIDLVQLFIEILTPLYKVDSCIRATTNGVPLKDYLAALQEFTSNKQIKFIEERGLFDELVVKE